MASPLDPGPDFGDPPALARLVAEHEETLTLLRRALLTDEQRQLLAAYEAASPQVRRSILTLLQHLAAVSPDDKNS
jgi:hypothetical protein